MRESVMYLLCREKWELRANFEKDTFRFVLERRIDKLMKLRTIFLLSATPSRFLPHESFPVGISIAVA
jgi:hypothetical protein